MKLNQYEWNPEKDKLGEGTFAEVFKAKDVYSNRDVALKIYKTAVKGSTTGSTGKSKYSLEQEFQNIQAVSHTNIITYYGLNYIKHTDAMGREGSHPVIIMEYANQGTLTEFLRTNPQPSTLNKLVSDIIKGVGHLHDEGIIHRDLKPGNILVNKNKRGTYSAKITDFGISKDTLSPENLTKPLTELIGTPHYMAPEQIYQKRFGLDGSISSRTDLWAVGVIIYKIFTGNLPFANGIQDIELVHEAITEGEIDLTKVPAQYHKLLKKCFQKNAGDRVSNAGQMLGLIGEDNEDLDRTVIIPDEEGTVHIGNFNSNDEGVKEEISSSPTKIQKTILAIFGVVNILWFGYYWFFGENTHYVFLLYPLTIILFCFFYLKPGRGFIVPKLLVSGLMMYYNIIFVIHMGRAFFEGNQKTTSILSIGFVVLFQVTLSVWLLLKEMGSVRKNTVTMGLTGFLLSTSVLGYLISYLLNIYGNTTGISTIFLISDSLTVFTLLPNIFFITALLFFVFQKHEKNLWVLLVLFVSSVGIASIWWLTVDYGNGYKIPLISSYMQELKIGYYLWFISLFLGFSVLLFDAFKTTRHKKTYWPIVVTLILALGITFYSKWENSKNAYNFNRGVENIDYDQFKKAFDFGKPSKVSPSKLKNFVKNMLVRYTDENADTFKRMLKLFVNSNGLVTYIEDTNLASAIEKEDAALLEILLHPTGSTRLENVDFVHEDKSLLQQARDQENVEIEKLLVSAGAKLTTQEKIVADLKKMKAERAKEFNYLENFAFGSTKFPEFSNTNSTWSYEFGKYKLSVKNKDVSHNKTAFFNLNTTETYTVGVKVTRGSKIGTVGLVFDSNNTDYHIAVVGNNTLILYKNLKGKWSKIKQVSVLTNNQTNSIKVLKNGNYVSCYLNGKMEIINQLINPTGGNYMGMINSNPKGSVTTYFDDFKVTGTKK
ncbi:serine/threonine-protein kinase [Costertonia aggregata]|uniref:Protein kinase n=1 Tax=Costertonia aggregata TaxID=343403 RepID=A0A7H9ANN8_9FLAO|nr:serine/threonine-protein kinase [Costertonia aggregata]QLG45069.1 protein kinase [Costertonia aggregata]